MKLTFLGTRGEIDLRTRLHRMHTSLGVSYRGHSVMIDCGTDWLRRAKRIRAGAIVLTHAHPDHSWGLKNGAPCAVYATDDTWSRISDFPIEERITVRPRRPFKIHGLTFEAFAVQHSTRAPAVGYRITAGRSTVFYVPDLVYIYERADALKDIRIYIGDGASLRRPLVRRRGGTLVAHTSVHAQIGWCRQEGVSHMIVTHCGTEIVEKSFRATAADLREMGRAKDSKIPNVEIQLAFDGLEIRLP